MDQIWKSSKDCALAVLPRFIWSINQDWSNWTWFLQSLNNFLCSWLLIMVVLDLTTQQWFNLVQYTQVFFVWLDSVLQCFRSRLPSHCFLVALSWFLSTLVNQGLKILDVLWNLVTDQVNLCYLSDLFDLSCRLFQLLTWNYILECYDKVFGLYFLLLSGITCINLAQSLSEVSALLSFKNFLLKIGPIEFSIRFTINCNNDPFEDVISLWFSVLDIDFGENFSINLWGNLDSFFPFSEILFLIDFDLFFILIFFVVIFEFSFIDFDLSIQVVDFMFQLNNGFLALLLVGFKFRNNWVDPICKTLDFTCFWFNCVDIFVDELSCQISKGFFQIDKLLRIVSDRLRQLKWIELDVSGHQWIWNLKIWKYYSLMNDSQSLIFNFNFMLYPTYELNLSNHFLNYQSLIRIFKL